MTESYRFEGGYPLAETVTRANDDADLARAIEAYRFFFPTVSGMAIWQENLALGLTPNHALGIMDTTPEQVGLTLNSDTPYAPIQLDLHAGPLVIEVPSGPLMGAALDLHQRWLGDLGLPGPDAGRGGRHLLLPPGWEGEVPDDVQVIRSSTYRVIGGVRVIPLGGDLEAAHALMRRVTVRPLAADPGWPDETWLDLNRPQDVTPTRWQGTMEYWRQLHLAVDGEPPITEWSGHYGILAALGIRAGRPFEAGARLAAILERAAGLADEQLRVRSLADRRPDREVWHGSSWEWPALRPENGEFLEGDTLDVDAREKWFYQAIAASPAMFRRDHAAGSAYWLATRDSDGRYLQGAGSYLLSVPSPVPARLFWSITAYDAHTRSQIASDQNRAALRSLFELRELQNDTVELHFAPEKPDGVPEERWVQTLPDRGWFVYFRIYGPEPAAFDGTWQLPDFRRTDS